MTVHQCIAQPRHAEYGDNGAHPRVEHRAFGNRVTIRFAKQDNQRGSGKHDDFDGVRHAHQFRAFFRLEGRAQLRYGAHDHHQQCGGKENPDRKFRLFADRRIGDFSRIFFVGFYIFRVFQQRLIMRVIFQLFAELVDEYAGKADT